MPNDLVIRPSIKSQFGHLTAAFAFVFLAFRGFSFEHGIFLYLGKISAGIAVFICLVILVNIFNFKYVLAEDFIQSIEGILSLNMVSQKVKYKDIKLLEAHQTILGRILGFGNVLIGSAATSNIEITLRNVSDPQLIKEFVLKKISQKRSEEKSDNNLKEARQSQNV
ncbi:MAG: PH domain-containing protein [Deltaproteobacteria bacterium]|nr:PH domain-containing protein [Deltaproteobacteria bacterium]